MKNNFVLFLLTIVLFSCGGNKHDAIDTSQSKEEGITNSSFVSGEKIYRQKCMVCHQESGQGGVGGLYPPLAKSDYLMADLNRSICITQKGLSGKITVNGKEYDSAMPPVTGLTPEKIRDLMNYIRNSWGNEGGTITTQKVEEALKLCK